MARFKILFLLVIPIIIMFSSCTSDDTENNDTKYWKKIQSPVSENLWGVFFINDKTGWAVGLNSTIIKTTDGGKNWVKQTYGEFANFMQVFFIDTNTGWAVGGNGTVVQTTNGGSTWTLLASGKMGNSDSPVIYDVHFFDSKKGWVVGERNNTQGFVASTTDGGKTWSSPNYQFPFRFYSLYALNQNQLYIGGGISSPPSLFYTSDGGKNWENIIVSNEQYGIDDIACKDPTIYLVNGGEGYAFTSNDMGKTWVKNSILSYTSEILIDDEVVWLLGGIPRLSTDGGKTFTVTTEANNQEVNDGGGFIDAYAIGKKAWGVTAGGGIFIFE